jgi:hypothetical protein
MDRGGVGSNKGFVGPEAGGFPGQGDAAAAAGAWLGHRRAEPISEPNCRGREPG